MWTIISYIAAFLTTISFVPQAIKTIKTRDTKDLSLLTYVMFVIGVLAWTAYGIIAKEYAIFYANAITSIFASIILYFKAIDVLESKNQRKKIIR